MDATSPGQSNGLLLTRDLMFTSKVTGTAAALGFPMQVVGSLDGLRSMLAETMPRAVFIDLACADFDPAEVMNCFGGAHRPVVIAFGSHVDVDRLESARQVGCDHVLPRSQFSAALPALLQQVFGSAG